MKCSTRRLMIVGSAVVFTVICLVHYYHEKLHWTEFSSEFVAKIDRSHPTFDNEKADKGNDEATLTTDEINARWTWTTFDVEKAAKDNADSPYYSDEELTPWIEKPMYSFQYPGKYGDPFVAGNLTSEEQKRYDEGWNKYQFNEFVCSKIPLHRYLRDDREAECKARKWRKPMAKTSIVVIFYNEAWCTLMRTVFSILETTPKILLKEIILVDDVSTYENLKEELDEFLKQLKIVRVIRMKERLGIVPARMAGARATTGEVIVFLDAHCECSKGWLEPLLERIAEEPNAVMCPVLEDMPFDTFSLTMRRTKDVPIGVTNWDLGFGWGGQHHRPANEPNDAVIKCPVMVGAMFAVRRSYFFDLGAFDEEMRFWGGEQLEISFRIWLCGGTLEIHPCSHVGHMHRRGFQYVDLSDAIARNNRRVAEVWMDEYKNQFYMRSPRARLIDAGDLSSRIALRERLHCKNFTWFIENLHPHLYAIPAADVIYWGQWATGTDPEAVCFDSAGDSTQPMILYPCHGKGINQLLMLTKRGEMRMNGEHEYCMIPGETGVTFRPCVYPKREVPDLQKWRFILEETDDKGTGKAASTNPRGKLQHSSGRCLQNIQDSMLDLRPCQDITDQVWFFRDMPTEKNFEP